MSAILFLQGPLGPFFANLAKHFSRQGIVTHKISFNGGDRAQGWAEHQAYYKAPIDEWAGFFEQYIQTQAIKAVIVYGDCRFYHQVAAQICRRLNLDFWVFEEGYLRPNFVTLEKGGVNAFSSTNWEIDAIRAFQLPTNSTVQTFNRRVGNTFFHRAAFACQYYIAICLLRSHYPHYQHHRMRSEKQELKNWCLSCFRKYLYKFTERNLLKELTRKFNQHYFLFPLQTQDDFQLREHSDFESVENSIEYVIDSFAKHALPDDILVIKHHPMDRGFYHYGALIESLTRLQKITERVIYCHDQHLPTLLHHTKGVVTINSTTGISALVHNVPIKVLGRALYNIDGLTHQGELAKFWRTPSTVDPKLFTCFRSYLYGKTQIDGSFFKTSKPLIDTSVHRLMASIRSKKHS